MKILSITQDEGRVIELTNGEWIQFKILSAALEGKTLDEFGYDVHFNHTNNMVTVEYDYSGVFGAIQAFYEAKFKLNELKQLVEKYDEYMKIKKDIDIK